MNAFVGDLSPDGGTRWARGFGTAYVATAAAVAVDGAGDVLVAGDFDGMLDVGAGPMNSSGPPVAGRRAAWVAKLAPDGHALWSNALAGAQSVHASDIAVDGVGNVFVAGGFSKTLDIVHCRRIRIRRRIRRCA